MTKKEITRAKELRKHSPEAACTKCGAPLYVQGLCVKCATDAQANVPATMADWSAMAEALFNPKGN